MTNFKIGLFFLGFGLLTSCNKTMPSAPEEFELLDGPMEGLSTEEQARFLAGDEAFAEVFTIEKGLGPIFVSNQCSSCHPGDGKGAPFVKFTRFGQANADGKNTFLHLGGPQLQHKAIPGYKPEQLPNGAPSTDLIAPAVTGLGFLDAVSDQTILDLADENDDNGDGISGRPHWNTIPEYIKLRPNTITNSGKYITRFGKKGGAYDLLHQSAGAYNQDMGIVSTFEPIDPYTGLTGDPEVSDNTMHNIVHYLKTLKAPIQRNSEDANVKEGQIIFDNIQCAACHTPKLKTGTSSISALNNKEFYPFTDLLLHDMGSNLDDGYTEGFAETFEWRTPPLWGLGLSKDAQGGVYLLMHDGRAKSIDEAILMHGGEAENSKSAYNQLSKEEQNNLIRFLESL